MITIISVTSIGQCQTPPPAGSPHRLFWQVRVCQGEIQQCVQNCLVPGCFFFRPAWGPSKPVASVVFLRGRRVLKAGTAAKHTNWMSDRGSNEVAQRFADELLVQKQCRCRSFSRPGGWLKAPVLGDVWGGFWRSNSRPVGQEPETGANKTKQRERERPL